MVLKETRKQQTYYDRRVGRYGRKQSRQFQMDTG